MNTVTEFLDAIRAHGLKPPDDIEPGRIYRFPGAGKGRSNKAGRCKLFEDGRGGWFKDLSTGLYKTWQAKRDTPFTEAEKAEWQRQREARRKKEAADSAKARARLQKQWAAARSEGGEHGYLKAKGVGAYGLRTQGDQLLIPARDGQGTLQGIQAISPSGDKKFETGSKKKGCYHTIGRPKGTLYIVEGYATGASIYEATQVAVAVAFDADNLLPVAKALRKKCPNLEIILAADNDQWTRGNPGVTKATAAARAVKGRIAIPSFKETSTRPTDFNDLHQLEGVEAVRQQLEGKTMSTTKKLIEKKSSISSTSSNSAADKAIHPALIQHPPAPKLSLSSTHELPSSPGVLVHQGEHGPKLKIASAAAAEALQVLRGRFAYDVESGIWHAFTGTHWKAEISAKTLHAQLTRWMYDATDSVGFTPRYMDSMLLLIQRLNALPLPEAHGVIPFKNGHLDPVTRTLTPIKPENALTWALPFEYHPGAKCPTIQAWLQAATGGDEEMVQLLHAFMAALLRGPSKYQKFLHLTGPGGTGKSTFIRLLQALVGEQNVTSTDLRRLEQNRFETALLYRKRLALIADTDKYGGTINVLKSITGEDPLPLEIKHKQQAGNFIFEGLVVIASNEALKTSDHTSGLERRRVTVPFKRRITQEEKDHWENLGGEAQLHAEIPGLVNWVLDLPLEAIGHLICHPPLAVISANLEAMRDENPVSDWVMECCIPSAEDWTQIGIKRPFFDRDSGIAYFAHTEDWLYANYLAWCQGNNRLPVSTRNFRHKLIDTLKNTLEVEVQELKRGPGMGIKGIRLRQPGEPMHDWLAGKGSLGKLPPNGQTLPSNDEEPSELKEAPTREIIRI
ncbi:phage/plasmid primase, P4 family [Nitrosococcus wardiae]|uniref:Toprim domain-containing protein n=1 Tax=Nitrosococcus wardiae TaxID=1814290 RepID=A0A4P7BWB4_9GAMM|nr:phage/plasmid primase, P4 family [Nitrosococcus wardiae]QBQ53370.1 toprim domain-containing protein [Nitrosococcus wardiae]